MNNLPTFYLLSSVLATSLLAGCAGMPFFGENTNAGGKPRKADVAPGRSQAALRQGINLYNAGDFGGAIARLSGPDIASGTTPVRAAALKYRAFSYCVTSRPLQCRQAFDEAFRLDPGFDLGPGEHGHPMWGPVFVRAKKGASPPSS